MPINTGRNVYILAAYVSYHTCPLPSNVPPGRGVSVSLSFMEVLCMPDGGDTHVQFWHGRGSEHNGHAVELKLGAGHGLWRGGDNWVIFFPKGA